MGSVPMAEGGLLFHSGRIAIILVGLPARGKTFISQKLARYLNWIGCNTRTFDVGHYRRHSIGAKQTHEFFDPDNVAAAQARRAVALSALKDMIKFFEEGGQVGIYDATNSTESMRRFLLNELSVTGDVAKVVFLECICDDLNVVSHLIDDEMQTSPDYAGTDPVVAAHDFEARIQHYQRRYETITSPELSYIKLINAGESLIVNNVSGYLCTRIVHFIMNVHIFRRSIYLCPLPKTLRPRTEDSKCPDGEAFAQSLYEFMTSIRGADAEPLSVWTSTSARARGTVDAFPAAHDYKVLADLSLGVADGLTNEQIAFRWPADAEAREKDPFNHRFLRGESMRDLSVRIEPVILELERQTADVLIVASEVVLRCIWAYYQEMEPHRIPHVRLPPNCVVQLRPRAYNCEETLHPVSTISWD